MPFANAESVITQVGEATTPESTSANLFIGLSAGLTAEAKCEGNIALGSEALASVTTGKNNTAIGTKALTVQQ